MKYGEASRIDILLEDAKKGRCYVEIKNVHLMRERGLAEFPDCVTARGVKHLRELSPMVAEGHRAVMLFSDPARRRQALRARARPRSGLLRRRSASAVAAGVEAMAFACRMSPEEIVLDKAVRMTP